MPNLDAAKKALRQSQRRRAVNDRWRRAYRESLKKFREALRDKDEAAAQKVLNEAQSNLDRAARRNILHPKAAARTKSRLTKALTSIQNG